MRLFGAMAVLAAVTGAWAGESAAANGTLVTVCLNTSTNPQVLGRGQGVASQILKKAGVQLEWRSDERACAAAEHGIVVTVWGATPADLHPGALAYAMPYERTRIVMFLDRVRNTVSPAATPFLAGYVLAHEICHMLQGVAGHAPDGIMKTRWDAGDYADMQRGRLGFTGEDVRMIHNNLDRNPRSAPAE